MEFNSIEFYTIAFCLAMGLVGFFLGVKKIKPASSRLGSFELEPQDVPPDYDEAGGSVITLAAHDDGTVTIVRHGLRLSEGETVNLIFNLNDDKLLVEEKKGKMSAFGGKESYYRGTLTVDFLPPNNKTYIRYESSVTGQWAKFSFKNTPGRNASHTMSY